MHRRSSSGSAGGWKSGGPLLDEGADAFSEICVPDTVDDRSRLGRQLLDQRGRRRCPDKALGGNDRASRCLREALRQPIGLKDESLGRNEAAQNSQSVRFRRIYLLGAEQQSPSCAFADDPRQQAGDAAIGTEAHPLMREHEGGAFVSDGHIGRQRE